LIYVWKKYKSALLITNQSIERTHSFNRQIEATISTKTGFGKNCTPAMEILYFRLRLLCYQDINLMEQILGTTITTSIKEVEG